MAIGTVSPGQKLTPDPNVFAPAGMGGDIWGANGGGAVAVGGGATDQTGYVKPIVISPSDCEMATNYIAPKYLPYSASELSLLNKAFASGQGTSPAGGGANAG